MSWEKWVRGAGAEGSRGMIGLGGLSPSRSITGEACVPSELAKRP